MVEEQRQGVGVCLAARCERLARHWRAEGQYGDIAENVGDEITAEYSRDANETADVLEAAAEALRGIAQ